LNSESPNGWSSSLNRPLTSDPFVSKMGTACPPASTSVGASTPDSTEPPNMSPTSSHLSPMTDSFPKPPDTPRQLQISLSSNPNRLSAPSRFTANTRITPSPQLP